jgi:SAM-dependent methyltransferase
MLIPHYTSNQLYRRLHVGHPTDIEIYRRLSCGAQRVLDLGCGWGRIALPLAEAGLHVVGIDTEDEFLKECREQLSARGLSARLDVQAADICSNALAPLLLARGPFDRVVLPYNTVYALGGRERVAGCLSTLRPHLTSDAEVWFDVYDVDEFHDSYDEDEDASADAEHEPPVTSWEAHGQTIEVFEVSETAPALQRLTVHYQARIGATGQCVGEQTLRHDYLLSRDIASLFDAAGYELVGCYPRSALHCAPQTSAAQGDDGDEQLFYLAEPRV